MIIQDRPVATERLATLHSEIVDSFSLEELRDITFFLGVRWESLAGDTIDAKTTSLLTVLNNSLRLPDLFAQLETQRPTHVWQPADVLAPPAPPYRGLEFYREQDAVIFCGRSRLSAQLIEQLSRYPVLVVVGASGSGKSSVVRAGVLPRLKGVCPLPPGTPTPSGSADWAFLTMTPRDQPLERLAVALTSDLAVGDDIRTVAAGLVADRHQVGVAVDKMLHRQGQSHLCLVVDQFEELFNPAVAEADRSAFIEGLLAAAVPGGSLSLILCLRADYYHRCEPYGPLRVVLTDHQVYIGALDAEEVAEVIVEPALRRGYALEPGLTELILRDMSDGPGRLPLLSHALHETWLRREGSLMTLAGYLATGGVDRAIATTAEQVYGQLSAEEQPLARCIFLELIQLDESGPDVRRPVARTLLDSLGDPAGVATTLEALIAARLVVVDQETVQIAHEALIHHWPQLAVWLRENREQLIFRRRVEAAAALWAAGNFDPDYLYGGRQLAQALERRRDYGLPPDAQVDSFLLASSTAERQQERFGGLRVFGVMLAGATALALTGFLLQTVWLESNLNLALMTAAFAILGAIVGLLYAPGFDWAMSWAGFPPAAGGSDDTARRWVVVGLLGFFVFGLTLILVNIGSPGTRWWVVFAVGGLWGIVAAVGRVWSDLRLPRIAVTGLASGLVLAAAYGLVAWAGWSGLGLHNGRPLPITLALAAGVLIPLSVLVAEWVSSAAGRRILR